MDFSCFIEPIQGDLLSCDSERNFFTDPEFVSLSLDLLEIYCDRDPQSEYSPWESMDVHGYEKFRIELERSYKAVRVANDVESSSPFSEPAFVIEELPEQRRRPAQRLCIDNRKTYHSGLADLLAGKLRLEH